MPRGPPLPPACPAPGLLAGSVPPFITPAPCEPVSATRPVPKHDPPAVHLVDQMQVVRGHHHRHADIRKSLEQSHHFERERGVQIACGFICNQQLGVSRPRRGQCPPAAARPWIIPMGGSFPCRAGPHLVERRAHPLVDLALRQPRDHQRQRHIVGYRTVMQKLVVLKDHADLAPKLRYAARLDGRRVLAVDDHLTARRPLDEGHQLEDAALTGT